jgi:hypothetical protein
VGGFYSRGGTDLLGSSAASSVGFGLGVSFLKDKLTLGEKYDTYLESTRTNDGNMAVTVNLNGPQRKGPSLGFGVGIMTLRLRGIFFAIATVAILFIM